MDYYGGDGYLTENWRLTDKTVAQLHVVSNAPCKHNNFQQSKTNSITMRSVFSAHQRANSILEAQLIFDLNHNPQVLSIAVILSEHFLTCLFDCFQRGYLNQHRPSGHSGWQCILGTLLP